MDFESVRLYVTFTNLIKEMQSKLDKSLCDMTAKASRRDDNALFNRWAAMLFLRLGELDENSIGELRRYVGERLAEDGEEYQAVLAVFSADKIEDILI